MRPGTPQASQLVQTFFLSFRECLGIPTAASRRARSPRATCTAVTLYSGQLVAQSEFSVVTTFAPVPGNGTWCRPRPAQRVRDLRAQHGFARAAGDDRTQSPVIDAAHFGIVRMNLQHVLACQADVAGAPRLRADVVLREHAARRQQQRIRAAARSLVGTYSVT